jgi:MFS family permease
MQEESFEGLIEITNDEEPSDTNKFGNEIEQEFCTLDQSRIAFLSLIFMVNFTEGADSLVVLATQYFSKDILGLTPTGTQLVIGSLSWPWLAKFFYGFLTDSVPIVKYRRKPYLLIVSAIAAISYVTVGCFVSSVSSLVVFMILSQFGTAFTDVITNGLIVEASSGKSVTTASRYQTLVVIGVSIGIVVTSLVGGYMIENLGSQATFFLLGLFPFLIMIIVPSINDEPTQMKIDLNNFKRQLIALQKAFYLPVVWKPCLLLFIMYSAPSADQGFFYFVTEKLEI